MVCPHCSAKFDVRFVLSTFEESVSRCDNCRGWLKNEKLSRVSNWGFVGSLVLSLTLVEIGDLSFVYSWAILGLSILTITTPFLIGFFSINYVKASADDEKIKPHKRLIDMAKLGAGILLIATSGWWLTDIKMHPTIDDMTSIDGQLETIYCEDSGIQSNNLSMHLEKPWIQIITPYISIKCNQWLEAIKVGDEQIKVLGIKEEEEQRFIAYIIEVNGDIYSSNHIGKEQKKLSLWTCFPFIFLVVMAIENMSRMRRAQRLKRMVGG